MAPDLHDKFAKITSSGVVFRWCQKAERTWCGWLGYCGDGMSTVLLRKFLKMDVC